MKVEYVEAMIGEGVNLVIKSEDFKKIENEKGWEKEQPSLRVAVNSYVQYFGCSNKIITRDLEEAFRHIKGSGTIVLATKSDGVDTWCEVYAVTAGSIIPVKTGKEATVNLTAKSRQQAKQTKKRQKADAEE